MADDAQNSDGLSIPAETGQKFPDLIAMIRKSESMDAEERQYWVDALPVMTDEQLNNLRGILNKEQQQIEKSKQAHQNSLAGMAKKYKMAFDSFEYKEKKRVMKETEKKTRHIEKGHLEKLLKEMDDIK